MTTEEFSTPEPWSDDDLAQLAEVSPNETPQYMTPTGHTYREPSTVEGVVDRALTYAQGIVESWDETELPPQPTWAMLGILLTEIDRLNRAAGSRLVDRVHATQARIDAGGSTSARRFVLDRSTDETGVSGTGVVAEGVEFSDGRVAMRWRTATTSVAVYDHIDDVRTIHGHDGATAIVYLD